MKPLFFPCLVIVVVAMLLLYGHCNSAPSPTPFDINKVDFSKITQEDIDRTIAHWKQLDKTGADINQKQAIVVDTQATALANVTKNLGDLQEQIKALAIHDRQMTDKVAEQQTVIVKKDLAILWRDVIIGIGAALIGVYLFLKFYMRLPI